MQLWNLSKINANSYNQTYIVKTRQTDRCHHLQAISCNERVIWLGVGAVPYWRGEGGQYICLVGCQIQPVDGHVAVCLVLTLDVHA